MVTWHSDVRWPDSGDDTIRLLAGRGPPEQMVNRLNIARVMASAAWARLSQTGHGFNPDEPRDWHGRWTTGGDGQVSPAVGYRRATPIPTGPIGVRRGLLDNETFGPSASGRLYGGRIIRTQGPGSGIGHNGPPEEEIPENEPLIGATGVAQGQPFIGAPQVPQGWDIPAHVVDGLLYPAIRRPVLPDGTPWPVATHDAIKTLLTKQGRGLPTVTILVPHDGIGPMLLGNNARGDDLEPPPGYGAVMLFGTPQTIYKQNREIGRRENGHADDSIQEALRLAQTLQFSAIYFNRGYGLVTKGEVESKRRPDVFAVALPPFSDPYRYRPYESFSDGQKAEQRQNELPNVPDIAPVYGTWPSQWKQNPDKK